MVDERKKISLERAKNDINTIREHLDCIEQELKGGYPHMSYMSEKLERIKKNIKCLEVECDYIAVGTG